MPFLQKELHKYCIYFKLFKKNVTLQVRNYPNLHHLFVKRVFPSASLKKSGSLAIEASLSLSLFIFTAVILMLPMKIMDSQRQVQSALEFVCEEVSQYAYMQSKMDNGNRGLGQAAYIQKKVRDKIKSKEIDNISLTKSKVLEDGETIDLILNYEVRLPFPVFRLDSLSMTARSCKRAWIGRNGGRSGNSLIDGDEELVFVGITGTRYHRSRTCHYIYNDISTIPFNQVGDYRNADGRKYKSCHRCGGSASLGSMVYIMPNGSSYHSSTNCSAISSYVRSVPLSTVEYLGPCSYCSK